MQAAPSPSTTAASPAPVRSGGLFEIWGDTVNLAHLALSIIIGAAISLGSYLVASQYLPSISSTPEMGRAYAMLFGLAGCLLAGLICARLFAPKREVVVEQGTDLFWREEVLEALVAETGSLGKMADLPPEAIQELKALGLYELFASHENMNAEQMAAEEQAHHEQVLREASHSQSQPMSGR